MILCPDWVRADQSAFSGIFNSKINNVKIIAMTASVNASTRVFGIISPYFHKIK